jgi:hypothetical protein
MFLVSGNLVDFRPNTRQFRSGTSYCANLAGRMHKGAGEMKQKPRNSQQDVVTLADLAPRQDVTGGSGRRVFGTDSHPRALEERTMAMKKSPKALRPSSSVKGGAGTSDGPKGPGKLATNDNVTLVRG